MEINYNKTLNENKWKINQWKINAAAIFVF